MNPAELLVALRRAQRQVAHAAAALRGGKLTKQDAVRMLRETEAQLAGEIACAERELPANPPLGIAAAVRAAVMRDNDAHYVESIKNPLVADAYRRNTTRVNADEWREQHVSNSYRFWRDELGLSIARSAARYL